MTVILSVGEVNKNKNHKVGIEALAKLKDRDIYYVICGCGSLMESCKELAERLGVGDRVILAGYRTDVYRFYKMADIFLFPSFREGLPVAVMEAIVSGLPVICSNIRGNTDLVTDREDGRVIELSVDQLEKAIIKLMDRPDLRQWYAAAALERVRQFELNSVVTQVKTIYEETLRESI